MNKRLKELNLFTEKLEEIPTELRCFIYDAESFGNWEILIRLHGRRLKIFYSGKDDFISIYESDSRKLPDLNWKLIWESKAELDWQKQVLVQLNKI